MWCLYFFFFNDTATTEIYTLSLHDALPILLLIILEESILRMLVSPAVVWVRLPASAQPASTTISNSKLFKTSMLLRSEEHTSELQSRQYLVCRLLLEKKKKNSI